MFWDHSLSQWLAIGVGYAVSTFLLVFLRPVSLRIGLVDKPNQRKLHTGQIPLIGGISMFCGFVFACMLLPLPLQDYRALFAAAGLLVLLGVLDDFKELSPRSRLIGQLLAAFLIIAWGRVALCDFGNLFGIGDILLPAWLGWIVSLFAIVSVINAINMMDGLDGLAGFVSLVSAGALCVLAVWYNNVVMIGLLAILIAVLLAFLQFNYRFSQGARLFMGDAGSMFLGVTLVWFAIKGSQDPVIIARPVTMLWLFALPLCEILTIVIYRVRHRRSPLEAGRDHMHYLLLRYLKWPAWQVTLLLGAIALLLAAVGVVGEIKQWPEFNLFMAFLGLFVIYAYSHLWLSRKEKQEHQVSPADKM